MQTRYRNVKKETQMKGKVYVQVILVGLACVVAVLLANCSGKSGAQTTTSDPVRDNALRMVDAGKQTFRFETFGDEAFWGDTIKLHQAIEGSNFVGGVGTGVSPKTALAVGLKVDLDALPQDLVNQLKNGTLNLDDPANTLALIKLNAVLGVSGTFNADGSMKSMGVQCALCHSTVDDALVPGIGHRLDGWANRDLNVGAIIALAPNLQPVATLLGVDVATVKLVLNGWGPGKYDAQLFLDGKAARPGGAAGSSATLIPPAFGLAGVNLHTSTGFGSVPYWNAFVAILEMHGKGTFFDPRLNDAVKFPIAANPANKSFDMRQTTPEGDLVTAKLAALHFYQLAIAAPTPPDGSFDKDAAARGKTLFAGKAKCATCHVPPLFTEPGWNMHTAAEIGIDDFQAKRSPDERYRTSPLKGLWSHAKGGFYHDGRFASMLDVVNHYDTFLVLGLTAAEKSDLVEYLKSL
jgi:hypothetical protein